MNACQGILLVDNHRIFRRTVRETIARRYPGITVVEALDREDAIRKVKRHRPGLIFTDIDIRGCRALDLLQRIHEVHPDGVYRGSDQLRSAGIPRGGVGPRRPALHFKIGLKRQRHHENRRG